MDQTFMTIHNLTSDANILFASESIADILGYQPSEVQGKSCFDYFHPDEVPFARTIHNRGVRLDKAAVLHYARILARDGRWIGCECCFTIVHDVLVACTSIYRRDAKSERRAIDAPQIRRIFSCSPRDPRYHMLEHLSPKFKMSPTEREPRAALILNRFTRNLTVMFATNAITTILGLRPGQIKNKSFYSCIQEAFLPEATKCLESAKANDSIAYLRFCFQDPRDDDELEAESDLADAGDGDSLREFTPPDDAMDVDPVRASRRRVRIKVEDDDDASRPLPHLPILPQSSHEGAESRRGTSIRQPSIELEAVVSCTSDGLVVVLRKARPPIPPAHPPLVAIDYGDGLFAAPWAQKPIPPRLPVDALYTFRPPLLPQYMPLRENVKDDVVGGPPVDGLMSSIREVAVFAWPVVGINPAMAAYGRGHPSGEAHPTRAAQQQHQQQQQQLLLLQCQQQQQQQQQQPRTHQQKRLRLQQPGGDDNIMADDARMQDHAAMAACLPKLTVDKGKGPSALDTTSFGQYGSTAGHDLPQTFSYGVRPGSCNLQATWAIPNTDPFASQLGTSSHPLSYAYSPYQNQQHPPSSGIHPLESSASQMIYSGVPTSTYAAPTSGHPQQPYGISTSTGPYQNPANSMQDPAYGWQ